MAAQGAVQIQEKVSRLLSRHNGKPVLKPNRTLSLRDAVANRKLQKGEASCITEMSVLMACWKLNHFVDGLCSNEINTFYTCVKEAQAAAKNKSDHNSTQGGRLHPKLATTLLKRYPNLRSEV
ncbi:coiled-coil-helix-coiled-coil-helix domain-containing protein 1 [Hippoglossus hippoglossus]|uniref:coiled-coil-helix-coiled-coil-helix domain-containing protein 1 n=1 Tax=Hippoglossus hippoglossus TaxID=8267 RepID=UPI00148E0FE3|nr:coiled-coil-helix-coiled-coil-helix domain-containing protein 1 [Hippoglossus hippoglossus]